MTDQHRPDDGTDLAEQLARLREDVDLLLLTRTDGPAPAARPDTSWQGMPPARAADAWAALIDWVDELVDRYALDETVPVCWYAHGAMVEELHALHLAWLAAYTTRGTAPSVEPAVWHDLLARTLVRIREWDRHGCTGGTHRPDAPIGPTEARRTERARHVHADLQARAARDGAAPADPR